MTEKNKNPFNRTDVPRDSFHGKPRKHSKDDLTVIFEGPLILDPIVVSKAPNMEFCITRSNKQVLKYKIRNLIYIFRVPPTLYMLGNIARQKDGKFRISCWRSLRPEDLKYERTALDRINCWKRMHLTIPSPLEGEELPQMKESPRWN